LKKHYIVLKKVKIPKSTIIQPYCVIGLEVPPYEKQDFKRIKKTSIGKKCYIESFSLIYEGAQIGNKVRIEPYL
jgi:UDP-3-O-[3-hydroxymyristoyl] glucosamine N-acyltransferase